MNMIFLVFIFFLFPSLGFLFVFLVVIFCWVTLRDTPFDIDFEFFPTSI